MRSQSLITLAAMTMVLSLGLAQSKAPTATTSKLGPTEVAGVPDLAVPESYKLRIRNLQYEQDRLLIRIQNLQIEEQKDRTESESRNQSISSVVYQLAAEKHIDLTQWVFDLDSLVWKQKKEK